MKENNVEYKQILIDNAICKRRFHLIYEEDPKTQEHVVIKCPHCAVTLFEAKHHSPVVLAREENLIKTPTGENPVTYECNFLAK